MKIKAIVPIKLNNERLPGKNTKLLGDKPLIHYILETLDKCDKIDEVYVYCSDDCVKDYIIGSDKIRFLKRPAYLDEPTSNFTQIFEEFSKVIDSDIYILTHATAPYISVETINKCIDNVANNGYDSSFSAEKIQDYLWKNNEPINFDSSNLPRSQDLEPIYRETSGVYVFKKEVFEKYKRRIGLNSCPVEVSFKESIDINYPKDFEMAEKFYDGNTKDLNKISLLDCTLRDGGCVNSFDFPFDDMKTIKDAIENSNIENIELGYINKKGKKENSTMFESTQAINEFINITHKKNNTNYVAMIDYGTYDFNQLDERGQNTVDGIRLAFHKKNIKEIIECVKILDSKGYDIYIQPMVVINYSEHELLDLISLINNLDCNIKAFYIVDSFGQMMPNDVRRIFNFIDQNLKRNIKIGFHGHNNMQLAFSNSIEFINLSTNRELILDCTLDGMGKGAGNCPTELIVSYINQKYNNKYDISKIYEVIDLIIRKYKASYSWGYDPKYLLSANYGSTPSYVNYFIKQYGLGLKELNDLLEMLDNSEKVASNNSYADKVYKNYMLRKKIND